MVRCDTNHDFAMELHTIDCCNHRHCGLDMYRRIWIGWYMARIGPKGSASPAKPVKVNVRACFVNEWARLFQKRQLLVSLLPKW